MSLKCRKCCARFTISITDDSKGYQCPLCNIWYSWIDGRPVAAVAPFAPRRQRLGSLGVNSK